MTKWYSLGRWSRDYAGVSTRESVAGQKDADGDVKTDTLELKPAAIKLQIRVTLKGLRPRVQPELKFLGISTADTHAQRRPLEPNRAVWGREVAVPARTQIGWPGGRGWCSPTSTDMTLGLLVEEASPARTGPAGCRTWPTPSTIKFTTEPATGRSIPRSPVRSPACAPM